MSTREGNLDAPTRHPLAWQDAAFYDEAACQHELERVFDICHGCRRCVSLCHSFPTLFDLIDAGETGEVESVAKADYAKVVDQCYLCDLCYMTKCPYTPPHPWNVDFPHLMLRAKAIKFKKGGVKVGEKFLASTDVHGQFAGIPIVVQTVNAINKTRAARKLMDGALGVHPGSTMATRAKWRASTCAAQRPAMLPPSTTASRRPARSWVVSLAIASLHSRRHAFALLLRSKARRCGGQQPNRYSLFAQFWAGCGMWAAA